MHYLPEYYDYPAVAKWLESEGINQVPEGLHDDFAITAMMMTVDPNTVRMKERGAAGKFSINGIDLAPAPKTIEWGKRIIEFRADATVKALEQAQSSGAGPEPAPTNQRPLAGTLSGSTEQFVSSAQQS